MRPRAVAIASLVALGACKAGKDYQEPRIELPASYAAAPPVENVQPADSSTARWWSQLHDEELTRLIERARTSNLDLRAAAARVREARALYDFAGGRAGPQVNAQAGYAWQETSTTLGNSFLASQGPTELFQLGFDAAWEVDVFGRNARGIEAARAGAQAAIEDSRDVLVTLYAELARNYVELRAAQKEADLTRANLALQQDTLDLVRVRATSELASG
ncbi:MAG: TolC family protein, partial [Planctomycetota bacterium]